jgi:3-oxoadipate enol-lactonase
MKTIDAGAVRLQVYDAGAGEPILFVHGFPLNHSMWQAQLTALADGHRVIAPDLRGFGGSMVTEGTVTMEQFADDCAALLDALKIHEPITFCGLSMGGYVGWQFFRRHRDRLKRLVLCDTRAVADSPEAAETRRKMAEHVTQAGTEAVAKAMLPKLFAAATLEQQPATVAAVQRMILTSPPAGIAAAQRGMAARPDVRAWLPTMDVPTLVIVGEEDAISPPEEMRQLADAIPGATFVKVSAAGHMAPMENPTAVNTAIREFMAGASR